MLGNSDSILYKCRCFDMRMLSREIIISISSEVVSPVLVASVLFLLDAISSFCVAL